VSSETQDAVLRTADVGRVSPAATAIFKLGRATSATGWGRPREFGF
jgi:hypothetical protein